MYLIKIKQLVRFTKSKKTVNLLGKSRGSHKVEQTLSLAGEARGSIRHHTSTLSVSDLRAQVGLLAVTELAVATLGNVAGNNVVTRLNRSHSLADTLHHTGAFVSEDRGKDALRIKATEGVQISVADTGGEDANTHFAGFGGSNGDGLNLQRLVCFPGHGGEALNGLKWKRSYK